MKITCKNLTVRINLLVKGHNNAASAPSMCKDNFDIRIKSPGTKRVEKTLEPTYRLPPPKPSKDLASRPKDTPFSKIENSRENWKLRYLC